MAALRAMLQLRPGSSSSSSSPTSNPLPLSSPSYPPTFAHLPSQLTDTAPQLTSTTLSFVTVSANNPPTAKFSTTPTSKKSFQNLGLHSGAASGNLGLVKFALDNGQPIDSVINGVLPIHAACCSNANVAVVLFLIERGADVNSRRLPRKYIGERVIGAQTVGTTGSTPLHFAAANGCLSIVEILLRHGAVADLADKYGSTPYSVATARNHPEVASTLHQHASMQRGLQVTTPMAELRDSRDRDLFTSPRGSGDFSRRVSAILALNTQEPTPSNGRRRSVDTNAAGSLSPLHLGTIYQRRVSLDQIRPMRHPDRKPRRDSDASNPETLVSGPSSYSTLVNPITLAGNDSRTHLDMAPVEESEEKLQSESSSMVQSVSQLPPSTSSGAMRRMSSVSESRARQSFDLRMFASLHGHDMAETEDEEDDGCFRRHSMHEPFGVSAGQDGTQFFSRSSGLASSMSDFSFQEPPPRQRTKGGKHRASFSGSATISGRFSRFWSYGAGKDVQEDGLHGKDGSAGSMGSLGRGVGYNGLSADELVKIDREVAALGLISKEAGVMRPRVGMMNRLSGIWPRRLTGPERATV